MRILLFTVAFLFSVTSQASVFIYNQAPLWQVTNYSYGDNFYSTSSSQIDQAVTSYGYSGKTLVGYVETGGIGTLPFHRTFKGAPQIDHFYTTRSGDYNSALSYGYTDEGTEGSLRTSPTSGQQALYRLSHYDGSTGDVEHYYGLDQSTKNTYVQYWGWSDEGVEGYIYPVPSANVAFDYKSVIGVGRTGTGSVVVTSPGVYDQDSNVHACGGTATVYIDSAAYATLTSFQYGVVPGTINTYGCYQTVPSAPYGTHFYHVEYVGFTAVHNSIVSGNYDEVIGPYTYEGNVTN